MSSLEIFAVIISLIGVTLTIKRNMWCWWFNFAAFLLYAYLFYTYKGEFKHEVRQFEKSYDNQQAEQISLMV